MDTALDLDAIEARALAAPGGTWDDATDGLWIAWHDPADDEFEPGDQCGSGRWIGIQEQSWHCGTGSEDPPAELWKFLASSRGDVLTLAREVRRLRKDLEEARGQAG